MTEDPDLRLKPFPLAGRVALVTGVSRRVGIGYAIARRLAALGASVFAHHWAPHDADRPWGADQDGPEAVLAAIADVAQERCGGRVDGCAADLADPQAPAAVVAAARDAFGHVDILVCNHASSDADGTLADVDAAMLDHHWAVNTRASLLLAQAFASQPDGRPGGRVVFMTSGQDLGPMPGEVAYAAAKGALSAITATVADELADRGITVNTVNPGPTDTGYLDAETVAATSRIFPAGRWGRPDDAARLVAWLVTDDAAWITGQVINSEGGFRRWAADS